MNTKTSLQSIRNSKCRHVPAAVLLAALTACGGGGGASGSSAELESSTAKKTTSPSQGKGNGFTTVSLDTSGTSTTTTTTTTSPSTSTDTSTTSTTTTSPSTSTDTSTSTTTTVPAPAPFACASGAITCVEVAATGSVTQVSVPVTFGQPFKAGDWQHTTQSLVAKVDGVTIPLQSDEISSHRDGSARFAVLSAQLANMQPGQTRIVNLYTGSKTASTPSVPADPDWNLELEAQVFDANGNVTANLIAQPQAQLKAQIASGSGRRLAGAVASEYTVVTSFRDKATNAVHPHLTARLHTRLVDGGNRIRTDMVLENTRTWTSNPRNITYSLAVKRNGTEIHTQPKFTHNHHARWHRVLWTGSPTRPETRVRHHMPYFMSTKVTWNYDLNVKISEAGLQHTANQLAGANTGPMGTAMLNPYMPNTGGRGEIGPLPLWTTQYLLSQDDRAFRSMMAIADAGASAPIHFRDDVTGYPLDVMTHPNVSVRFGASSPQIPISSDSTVWTPDTAHQPSLSYIPYLITGDSFYLDETIFWAAWNIASVDPSYREGSKGLIHANELRAQAWAMRSIAEAVWATPDVHGMKSYFAARLTNNTAYYKTAFPNHPLQSPLGMISWSTEKASVWQNDYFSIVLSLLAENNEPDALSGLNWFSKFTVGRFLNEANGFCVAAAAGDYWINKVNGVYVNTWVDLFNRNYPADVGKSCNSLPVKEGYPDWGAGYAASARAMLGATANAGITGARDAYVRWKAMTPMMDANIAGGETAWAIVPR